MSKPTTVSKVEKVIKLCEHEIRNNLIKGKKNKNRMQVFNLNNLTCAKYN